MFDLVIIGGGVAGCFAYLSYKKKNPNKKVLILEHNKELLKKLSVTGNGKCNFTNSFVESSIFENGVKFKNILNEKSCEKILNIFDSLGIKYTKDNEGRYYPYSLSAKTVIDKIKYNIDKDDYLLDIKIEDIIYDNNDTYSINFKKDEENNTIKTKNLLISTGSKNYSKSGSDGSLFKYINKLGHSFTELYPADIWINVKEKEITKEISGLRCKSKLKLFIDNKIIYEETGELLFKDNAISGIVSFNISHKIAQLYKNNISSKLKILVDFVPDIDCDKLNKSNIKNELYSYLHPNIAKELSKHINEYDNSSDILKNFAFTIDSLGDFEYAQTTCGGIKINEIDNNFRSLIKSNLFFAGDLIDVSAPCGGYNLTFAILSGYKVGEEID